MPHLPTFKIKLKPKSEIVDNMKEALAAKDEEIARLKAQLAGAGGSADVQ